MSKIAVLNMAAVVMFLSCAAHADEFGPRFYGQAPAGLGDFTASEIQTQDIAQDERTAEDLQEIMPAAGDEAAETVVEDASVQNKK